MNVANNKAKMIEWRLRVLMAEKRINNRDLAKLTGIHETTISRLKNAETPKQISLEVLNKILSALGCKDLRDIMIFHPEDPDTPPTPPAKTQEVAVDGHQATGAKKTKEVLPSNVIEVIFPRHSA